MREKLIELVAEKDMECNYMDCCKCEYFKAKRCKASMIADHLIANGVTVQDDKDNNVPSKWISVKDRLPDKHGETYVCLLKFPESNEGFPHCLKWYEYGDNGYVDGPHFSDEGVCGLTVTHWMPLPSVEGLK